MPETLQQKEAFEYYYGMGADRSYNAVSIKFNVSKGTIANWGKKFNWPERVEQRDIENARELEKKTNNTIVNEKANYRKIIKDAIATFVNNLKDNKIDVGNIQDLERLIKLDLLLMGEATERGKIEIESPREQIASRITSIASRIGKEESSK